MFDVDDAVGAGGEVEVVGNHQRGAAFDEAFDGVADDGFAVAVEAGGGFVQEDDGALSQCGAGDGDALSLAAGEG